MLLQCKKTALPVVLNSGKELVEVLGCCADEDGSPVVFVAAVDVVGVKAATVVDDEDIIDACLDRDGAVFEPSTRKRGLCDKYEIYFTSLDYSNPPFLAERIKKVK